MPLNFLHKTFGIGKKELPIVIFTLFSVVFFGVHFLKPVNYEFLIYATIIITFLGIILISNKKVKYPSVVLWFLAICVFLHLAGGSIMIDGEVLYYHIFFNLMDNYPVLRYDQIVHTFGFFTATLLAYAIIRHRIERKRVGYGIGIILIMSGMGFGALNEVMEFIISQNIKNNLVGGYINTGIDLVANLIGSCLAVIYIKLFLEQEHLKEEN